MREIPENNDLRILMVTHNIQSYEVAKYLRIHPSTLSIWMNKRMGTAKKELIKMAIEDLKEHTPPTKV